MSSTLVHEEGSTVVSSVNPWAWSKKLRKAKAEAKPNEKPDQVKTHLRNMIVVPEMIGSVMGIYTGKIFAPVEIKAEMVGHYLGEFAIS